MGYHVDIDDLNQAKETYLSMSRTAQSKLSTAKNAMNGIITSNSMHGQVGKAVANEINNFHNPYLVGLKNSLELLDMDFARTIAEFQSTTGETSQYAILNEETLTSLHKKLSDARIEQNNRKGNFETIYKSIDDLVSLTNPSTSKVDSEMEAAMKHLSDTNQKVNSFDSQQTSLQSESLLSGLDHLTSVLSQAKSLSYSDPRLIEFVQKDALRNGVKQTDENIQKFKKDQKIKAEEAAKKKQEDWAKHHPIQAWMKGVSDSIGDWWDGVVKDTRNSSLPYQAKQALLELEGLVGGLGEFISDASVMIVDLGQLAVTGVTLGVDHMTGHESAQWMKDDWDGAGQNFNTFHRISQGAFQYVMRGFQTDDLAYLNSPEERDNARLFKQTMDHLGGEVWNTLTHLDGGYTRGKLIFDIGSMFIGVGEAKAALQSTKVGTKIVDFVSALRQAGKMKFLEKFGTFVPKGFKGQRLVGEGAELTAKLSKSGLREVLNAEDFAKYSDEVQKMMAKADDPTKEIIGHLLEKEELLTSAERLEKLRPSLWQLVKDKVTDLTGEFADHHSLNKLSQFVLKAERRQMIADDLYAKARNFANQTFQEAGAGLATLSGTGGGNEKLAQFYQKLGDFYQSSADDALSKAAKYEEKLRLRSVDFKTSREIMSNLNKYTDELREAISHIDDIDLQQQLLRQIDRGELLLQTNLHKGNFGEMLMDEVYRQKGYQWINKEMVKGLDDATHLGIDGVYFNPNGHPPFIIAEAKYNTARLSYLRKDGVRVGKQMDEKWIRKRLTQAVGERRMREIRNAMVKNEVGT